VLYFKGAAPKKKTFVLSRPSAYFILDKTIILAIENMNDSDFSPFFY